MKITPLEEIIMYATITMGLIMFFSLLSLSGCMEKVNERIGLDNDNFIEEAIEDALQDQTGLDIDLTPSDNE